jgi:hypothetical protein
MNNRKIILTISNLVGSVGQFADVGVHRCAVGSTDVTVDGRFLPQIL